MDAVGKAIQVCQIEGEFVILRSDRINFLQASLSRFIAVLRCYEGASILSILALL